jgi:glycosyltransferase involved in cell wall biosynthesis
MLVSIITVCFNSEKTIRDTVESILSQDYSEIEYIVIDGGSTDGTLELLNEYRGRITKILSEPDYGIYDAMNKGISMSSGSVIGMLNSDDVYINASVVTELICAMTSANTDSVFADLVVVDQDNPLEIKRYYDSSFFTPSRFRYGWMPAHPTFFVKKSVYDDVGLYSLDYKIASDYEMLIRILSVKKYTYTYLPKPVIKMRHGGASNSGLYQSWILNAEIVRACRVNGIWTALPLLALKIPRKLLGLLQLKSGSEL